MPTSDPPQFAAQLGLSYVTDGSAGITRVRRGRGFSFHDADGGLLDGADRQRCLTLAIPPAWDDVWICPDVDGHVQAFGTDAAGRRQSRYHERWTEGRRLANFDRLRDMEPRLRKVRAQLDRLLTDTSDPVRRANSAMVRLVDVGMARIGGARSAREAGHYGVSTLRSEHVAVDGDHVTLVYPGKSGVDQHVEIEDALVAEVLADLEVASDNLFEIRVDDGVTTLRASHANELLAELTGGGMTCKDFRTWGGSAVALEARVGGADAVAAVDAASEKLGNTRAVARSSYVHPDVLAAPLPELEDAWRGSRSSRRFDRRERALALFLSERPSLLEAYVMHGTATGWEPLAEAS